MVNLKKDIFNFTVRENIYNRHIFKKFYWNIKLLKNFLFFYVLRNRFSESYFKILAIIKW